MVRAVMILRSHEVEEPQTFDPCRHLRISARHLKNDGIVTLRAHDGPGMVLAQLNDMRRDHSPQGPQNRAVPGRDRSDPARDLRHSCLRPRGHQIHIDEMGAQGIQFDGGPVRGRVGFQSPHDFRQRGERALSGLGQAVALRRPVRCGMCVLRKRRIGEATSRRQVDRRQADITDPFKRHGMAISPWPPDV